MALSIRPERPEDVGEIARVVEAAFEDASVAAFTHEIRESPGYVDELTFVGERIPNAAWLALPLRAYDPSIRGRVVYPPFFPPPPGA